MLSLLNLQWIAIGALLLVGGYYTVKTISYRQGVAEGRRLERADNQRATDALNARIAALGRELETQRALQETRDRLLREALAADDGDPCIVSEAYRARLNGLLQ